MTMRTGRSGAEELAVWVKAVHCVSFRLFEMEKENWKSMLRREGGFMGAQETVYLKLDRNVETEKEDVSLGDLGKVYCGDKELLAKAKAVRLYKFRDPREPRCVISVMKAIQALQELAPSVSVESVGEKEVVVKRVKVKRDKGPWVWAKTAFVALICFFGTAFTIMAFHNDIGINQVFMKIYELVTGEASDGYTILEVAYSVGLAVGIIIFFNHIGGRRITKDPTPIEVEMRVYEDSVNNALAETADREGRMIDVS